MDCVSPDGKFLRPRKILFICLFFIDSFAFAKPIHQAVTCHPYTSEKPQNERVQICYATMRIPKKSFVMGCTSEQESDCDRDEFPPHKNIIRRPFYVMQSEVTQALWFKVMGKNPSQFTDCGDNCPVESISWYDAATFANRLNALEKRESCYRVRGEEVTWPKGKKCRGWRLPTEAEWEAAARGPENATPTKYVGTDDAPTSAWYMVNSKSRPHWVCTKQKNGYGLCDMSGNVWEWVWDRYGTFPKSKVIDSFGPNSGTFRVLRGGGWSSLRAWAVRTTKREHAQPELRFSYFGLRLVRAAD